MTWWAAFILFAIGVFGTVVSNNEVVWWIAVLLIVFGWLVI